MRVQGASSLWQTNNSNCVVQIQDVTGMEICSANCAGVELVDSTFMTKKGVLCWL